MLLDIGRRLNLFPGDRDPQLVGADLDPSKRHERQMAADKALLDGRELGLVSLDIDVDILELADLLAIEIDSARADIGCSTRENPPPDSSPSIMNRTPMLPRKPALPSLGPTTFVVVAITLFGLSLDAALANSPRPYRPSVLLGCRDYRVWRLCTGNSFTSGGFGKP
jgi:hypothetical protein